MNCPDSASYEIEVFFDGACPLCRREVEFLRRLDRRGKIRFTDISSPDFKAVSVGKTDDALMAQLHGRLPDGTWLQGVDVFRRLYAAVGFGPLVFLSRLPLISQLLTWGYSVFARNRLRLTGRCNTTSCTAKPDGAAAHAPEKAPD
jgi:predicted DCC family thiol-disulfide oxidoreductase YuxK